MNWKTKLIAVLIPLGLLTGTAAAAPEAVRINAGLSLGSGFQVADNLVITADHVVDGLLENAVVVVTWETGEKTTATVAYKNSLKDTAVLRLQGEHPYKTQTLECRTPIAGEKVLHIGNPYGLPFWKAEGRVSHGPKDFSSSIGRWPRGYYIDLTAGPGSSGGPVFSANGGVMGMVVGQLSANPRIIIITPGADSCAAIEEYRKDLKRG